MAHAEALFGPSSPGVSCRALPCRHSFRLGGSRRGARVGPTLAASGQGERSPQAGRAPARPCCAGLLPRGLGFTHVVLAAQWPTTPRAVKKISASENGVL
jgi:hypothetical protein